MDKKSDRMVTRNIVGLMWVSLIGALFFGAIPLFGGEGFAEVQVNFLGYGGSIDIRYAPVVAFLVYGARLSRQVLRD